MIEVNNLSFAYGDKQIFRDYSLRIPDGTTCLSGCSGCGKTTLLYLIAGLLSPHKGKITGVPERVAFMFQEDRLLPWFSAEQNVAAVLPKDRKDEARGYLRGVELENEADSMPHNLSGGQKRRVALARTLAFEGNLIILDEPFKGLDNALIARLVPIILSQNVPVIAATHSPEEMKLLGGHVIEIKETR